MISLLISDHQHQHHTPASHKSGIILPSKNCQTSQLCDLFYTSCTLQSPVHHRTFGKHLQLLVPCIFQLSPCILTRNLSFTATALSFLSITDDVDPSEMTLSWEMCGFHSLHFISCLEHLASLVWGQTDTLWRLRALTLTLDTPVPPGPVSHVPHHQGQCQCPSPVPGLLLGCHPSPPQSH